jgi:hypothetical protein
MITPYYIIELNKTSPIAAYIYIPVRTAQRTIVNEILVANPIIGTAHFLNTQLLTNVFLTQREISWPSQLTLATGSYPEPPQCISHPLKVHFNIILPSTSPFPTFSLSIGLYNKNLYIFFVGPSFGVSRPSRNQPNNTNEGYYKVGTL